jgi:hypothetical protein
MRLDASARDTRDETPRLDQQLASRELPALVARLRRLVDSQPTAVLGVLDYWVGQHVENARVEIDDVATERLDLEA